MLSLTIILSAPLILAAMGGFVSERSGVINIGLEGLMLIAACVTALLTLPYGPYVGLLAGVVSAIVLSLIHWLATQIYQVDHVISGMAINLVAAGSTNFLFEKFSDPSRTGQLPVLPLNWFNALAFVVPFMLWLYVRSTRGGLRLLAVGSDPDKARLAGVQPIRLRFVCLVMTGVLAGLGGASLVTYTKVFTDNMTAGRGYIALAALVLGGWRPLPALGACIIFGFFEALGLLLQGQTVFGMQPPSEMWASLPYLATVVALAGFLGKNRTPAGLGKA